MSTDPKCYQLAAEYLAGRSWANTHTVQRLAQTIQDWVEQWIDDEIEAATKAGEL